MPCKFLILPRFGIAAAICPLLNMDPEVQVLRPVFSLDYLHNFIFISEMKRPKSVFMYINDERIGFELI